MPYLLGLDTGGTFTDAALMDGGTDGDMPKMVAKAKALTTRHDLAIGLGNAARNALDKSDINPSEIGLVSLSTTLATNALVEGQGGRIALVAIGFSSSDLQRAGLNEALGSDPVIEIAGGHTTHGQEVAPLDLKALRTQFAGIADQVAGFAVAGYFAVRNPAHERAVRDLLLAETGLPVTCSHELSAKLNGPKRALTTVLNARLVPMITRLIEATERTLSDIGIKAPVTVVRGDGALVGASFATRRPIETILSGPAASLVGARFLTGEDNAMICDIGGTTSDVALLADGKPMLDPQGAMVGGFRTMVEAVAMYTFGLGGDSEVSIGGSALHPEIALGPRRLVPVSLAASEAPDTVHAAMDRQLKSTLNGRHDGRFAKRSGAGIASGLGKNEAALFEQLSGAFQPLDELLQSNVQAAAMSKLVARGLALVSGLTPSDAMHVLAHQSDWDSDAAMKALQLFARQRSGGGDPLFKEPETLALTIYNQVQRRSAEVVLQTAFSIDGKDGAALVEHEIVREALTSQQTLTQARPLVARSISLDRPLIGLGASAFQYHPGAARLLKTNAIVHEHADVANAIGAVVGQVQQRVDVQITQPGEGQFSVTGIDKPFISEAEAISAARDLAQKTACQRAEDAGAQEIEVVVNLEEKRASIESRDMLIEALVTAIATGRPPIVGD